MLIEKSVNKINAVDILLVRDGSSASFRVQDDAAFRRRRFVGISTVYYIYRKNKRC